MEEQTVWATLKNQKCVLPNGWMLKMTMPILIVSSMAAGQSGRPTRSAMHSVRPRRQEHVQIQFQ